MNLIKTSALIFSYLFSMIAYGQKEVSNWYFGYGAGLDFNSGKPVFQSGKINQWEGCASISDKKGNLLFYTDGRSAWNREHVIMKNGRGLKGHNSSTQSGIIVPHPGEDNLFYLFTVAREGGSEGLQYSIVDMNADNEKGDITVKNIRLLSPVCEKITAVRHGNNRDIWVITHKYLSDEYVAYLVTGKGLQTEPVTSKTTNHIKGLLNTIGYLKSSPDGKKLAAAHFYSGIEVSDFDNQTGKITNTVLIPAEKGLLPMGIEFSPDIKWLYTTQGNTVSVRGNYSIVQFRLHPRADSMISSKTIISSGDIGGTAGALQLGPDNIIYIAFNQKNFLGAITRPNAKGNDSGFILEYITIPAPHKSGIGLPTFIQSYFNPPPSSGHLIYISGFIFLLILLVLLLLWRRRKKEEKQPLP